jgi:hypothetical protein
VLLQEYLSANFSGYHEASSQSTGDAVHIEDTVPFKINQQRMARRAPGHLRHTLFNLLHRYQKAKCADPRDKVYSLLGLSRACCQEAITIDYQSSPLELCQLLLRHHLLYHSSEESNPQVLWIQVRETFRFLMGWRPKRDIWCLMLSSEVSLSRQDTTCASLACRSMGAITWLNKKHIFSDGSEQYRPTSANLYLDPTTRSRMRADIIDFNVKYPSLITAELSSAGVSNVKLCKLWLKATLRDLSFLEERLDRHSRGYYYPVNRDQPAAFVTKGGWSGEALGRAQVGDLAYELNNKEAIFLRREGERLLLVGVSRCAVLLRPDILIPRDKLFIDISVLEEFCYFFAGVVTFRTPGFGLPDSNNEIDGDINCLTSLRN